ncbi:MAG TPA: translation elongation factor Ts [Bacteroidales bacterium]|jgi:elongation factor Ts|nr:MAG: Elongation factor Ts [Bacteroidetes bacterium ADurb.Bin012]HNQ59142.1 translation elongation factor Ts [Bacteroidales bacterium]HNU20802.1 translation elongation factor Ts [Bacteroidales bacterium]HNV16464.1 translation elongation factor Ts [Bacteroidales bacterium]HNZ78521.1 translation elongation factor Ts [Bacteroidales bacterium]
MPISASDVNKLRQITGAGIMDCKHALEESNGDFDQAIDILRKKGQKIANKRADRDTSEGMVKAATNPEKTYGAIIMVNCETDFVASNSEFTQLVKKLMDKIIEKKPKSLDEARNLKLDDRTFDDHLTELIGKTGEKMEFSIFQYIEAPLVDAYNHHNNRLATIVGFNKNDREEFATIAHEVAMQIAAMNPIAIDKDDVDPKIIEHEMEIGREQARTEGKAENMLDKIAEGKINRFFKESTLLNQDFVSDQKKTVGQYISEFDKELKVTKFYRLILGE